MVNRGKDTFCTFDVATVRCLTILLVVQKGAYISMEGSLCAAGSGEGDIDASSLKR